MYPIILKELRYIVRNIIKENNELPDGLASVVDAVVGAQGLSTDHSTVRSIVYGETIPKAAAAATAAQGVNDLIYIDLYPFVYGRTIGNKSFIDAMHLAVAEEYLKEIAESDKPADYAEVAAALFAMRYRFFIASIAGTRGYIFKYKWEAHPDMSQAIELYAAGGQRLWLRDCLGVSTMNTVVRAFVADMDKHAFEGRDLSRMASRVTKLLYVPKFEMKLGVYKNKISFLNGIVDLSLHETKLRAERPNDYSTLNTKIPFRPPTDKENKRLDAVLEDVFPEGDEREYFLDKYAGVLFGYNRFRDLVISLGKGGNSKSVMQSVIEHAFGDYCATAPTDLFYSPLSSSSKPSPGLISLKGKLLAMASEPPLDKPILAATVKALTGNDRLSVRDLYESQTSMTLNAQFFIICNEFPKVDRNDNAYNDRVRYLTYRTTFVDAHKVAWREEMDERVRKSANNPSALPPSYIRASEIGIEKLVAELAITLAYRLVDRFITKVRDMTEQVVPDSILATSKALSATHSIVGEFMAARLDGPDTLTTHCAVPMASVYAEYKNYMQELHASQRPLDMTGLITAIEAAAVASNVIERTKTKGVMLLCHQIKALSV